MRACVLGGVRSNGEDTLTVALHGMVWLGVHVRMCVCVCVCESLSVARRPCDVTHPFTPHSVAGAGDLHERLQPADIAHFSMVHHGDH